MGNKHKTQRKKLLFEQEVADSVRKSRDFPEKLANSQEIPRQNIEIPKETHEISLESARNLAKTFNFIERLGVFSSISQINHELPDLSSLLLDFSSKGASSLANHAQILTIHSKLEYYPEFFRNPRGFPAFFSSKSMDMSPIRGSDDAYLRKTPRNHENRQVFETPSPLRREFMGFLSGNSEEMLEKPENEQISKKDEKVSKKDEKFTKNAEKFAKNDEKFAKNDEKFTKYAQNLSKNDENFTNNDGKFTKNDEKIVYRPNFSHIQLIPTDFRDSPEKKLRKSLRKLEKKLEKKNAFLRLSKEKVNETPLYSLDLWKMAPENAYKQQFSLKKSRNSRVLVENTENLEVLELDLTTSKRKSRKDLIKSEYSQENLEKYLNKTCSDFSNNRRFLREKPKNSDFKENDAQARGNFLYMKYDFPQKLAKTPENEQKNLQNSLSFLKKSMNYPQNSCKIVKTVRKFEETPADTRKSPMSDAEFLRNSLYLSKTPRISSKIP